MITETTYCPEWTYSRGSYITLAELSKFVKDLESAGCDPYFTLIYPAEGLVARKVAP